MSVSFFTPSFVIKNISKKAVRVLDSATIQPGDTIDLYTLYDPQRDLFEDLIIKHLEAPWGDLYVEVVEKKTLVLISCDLASWHYSIVGPSNITSTNTFFAGAVPSAVDETTFTWIPAGSGGTSLPPASSGVDGYLTAIDWARFDASVKPDMQIWQYQDFLAPVGSSVTLSQFQNGTSTFNSSYILDQTAVVTLTSNPSSHPTTTNIIPAKYLPSNRVTVSSHIGTTVTFNNIVEPGQNVRVYYTIRLPAEISLPVDYKEDPKFLNTSSSNILDENYVNQNQDENIYGIKTFKDNVIIDANLQYIPESTDGYYLSSDSLGNASWNPSPITSITPPSSPFNGQSWIDLKTNELYVYDGVRLKWLSNRTITYIAGRNKNKSSDIYLYSSNGITTKIAPFILPFDATLIAISASSSKFQTWALEVHTNNSSVPGANLLMVLNKAASDSTINVDFFKNDGIQVYMNGKLISHPQVSLIFARRG